MAWVTQAQIIDLIGSKVVIGMSDDGDDPSAIDTDVIDQCIDWAEAIAKAHLRKRYPTECDAGTAADLLTMLCGHLAVSELAIRRPGPGLGGNWGVLGTEAKDTLQQIRNGSLDVPEWEAASETTAIITTGKIEPQYPTDLFDYAIDGYRVPNEHDEDER